MPFTLSHPAAILPLHKIFREKISLLALILGSMSPDFGYYFCFNNYFLRDAHSLERSFTFCLPIGLFVFFALQYLANGFTIFFPSRLQVIHTALFNKKTNHWKQIIPISIGILLGAWTHIFWDSFTHPHGFFVNPIPLLQIQVVDHWFAYRLAQHFSSFFGAFAIALYCIKKIKLDPLSLVEKKELQKISLLFLLLFSFALCFTLVFMEASWNLRLSANDRRAWFLFLTSFLRNFGIICILHSTCFSLSKKLS